MEGKSFACVVNCMDGRVQESVIAYLKEKLHVDYVDDVTEPGPIKIMSEQSEPCTSNIRLRCDISVEKHGAVGLAVVGHHDCAGNPVAKEQQTEQILASVKLLRHWYPDMPVYGLWVDEQWSVSEVVSDVPGQE